MMAFRCYWGHAHIYPGEWETVTDDLLYTWAESLPLEECRSEAKDAVDLYRVAQACYETTGAPLVIA